MAYRPLFIIGIARSGTNLLARMLDRHPAISMALDPFLPLFRAIRNALVYSDASNGLCQQFDRSSPFQDYYFAPEGPTLLDLVVNAKVCPRIARDELPDLIDKIVARAALESPEVAMLMRTITGNDYGQLLQSGVEIVSALKPNVSWAGSKELWVIEFVPLLARIFPNARFLLIERDPRAVLASLLAMAERDPTQAAHPPSYLRHWRKHVALTRFFERVPLLAGRFRRVTYEALIAAPEGNARRLCDFLEIDYRSDMLRLSSGGWNGNSSFDHVSNDVYSDTVDRWRKVLPQRMIQMADYFCGPEMRLTEYEAEELQNPDDVLKCMRDLAETTGAWRSDSGDLLTDFGGEMVRHVLASSTEPLPESLVRRCFLFEATLCEIRANKK